MGKKRSGHGCNDGGGGEKGWEWEEEAVPAREFVLKVAMHCRCRGCTDKLRAAVRDLTQATGVEDADTSAAESSGEVRLLATADPEKLRRRLHKATGKKVDLLLPKERGAGGGKKGGELADDAALRALIANLQLQQAPAGRQQYGGHGAAAPAWAANQQMLMGLGLGSGGSYGGAGGYGAAYPWPSSSGPSYYQTAPGAGLGAYGYAPPAPAPAPVHGNVGYYGGGAPAWLGHGY